MIRGTSPVRCSNSKARMLRSSSHSREALEEAFLRSISTWQPLCCKNVTRTFLKNETLAGLSHENKGEYLIIIKLSNSLSKWGFGPLFMVSLRKCSIFLSTRGFGGGPSERPARRCFGPAPRCCGCCCCCCRMLRSACVAGTRRSFCRDVPRRPVLPPIPIEPPIAPIAPPMVSEPSLNRLLFGNCSSPLKERMLLKVFRIPASFEMP
mmetsp:Transcript_25712/g.54932  ORF Transcript_25712/g.54932 Transcript_25712/m.54932 type:complete len:208 (-) Transcript_25712:1079-1702(-)